MVIERKTAIGRVLALEPLLTRGVIVGLLGAFGVIANMQISEGTTEHVINVVLGAFGFLTAIVTRPAVTPNVKVARMLPRPFSSDRTIYGEDQI